MQDDNPEPPGDRLADLFEALKERARKPRAQRRGPLAPEQAAAIRAALAETPLSMRAIARQRGVAPSTISRQAARHRVKRHPEAPALAGSAAQRRQAIRAGLSKHSLAVLERAMEFFDSGQLKMTQANFGRVQRLIKLSAQLAEPPRRQSRQPRA
jgi:hypothetical protein